MKNFKSISFLLFCLMANFVLGQSNISSFTEMMESGVDSDVETATQNDNTSLYSDWFKVTEVNLYGAGNVLGLVTGDNEIDKTTAPTGSIGLNFNTNMLFCNLYFSYNGKQKVEVNTLSQFGNTIMNPNLAGQSFTFSIRNVFGDKNDQNIPRYGLSSSITVADNIYVINDNEIDASPFTVKFGGYISPFKFDLANNKVNILLDIHYTHRSILGDFSNELQTIEDREILNENYNGIDVSLNAMLNNVNLFVQFSFNQKDDNFIIPGYSGTQVLFGLEVSGNFIKLK